MFDGVLLRVRKIFLKTPAGYATAMQCQAPLNTRMLWVVVSRETSTCHLISSQSREAKQRGFLQALGDQGHQEQVLQVL
uniref:Uncharacterized protein n=1 Tax=Scleropages formosus TaxID=113540 RepID=A0A8C9WR65_SCLFO